MGLHTGISYRDRVFDGYRFPSEMFEQFLQEGGYTFEYYPSTLKYRVDAPKENAHMTCLKMEIDYFAGELRAHSVGWEPLDDDERFKEVIRAAGDLLTIDRIPLAFGALPKDGLYRRFLKWRLENNR